MTAGNRHTKFQGQMKMAEIIQSDFTLLDVLNRFEIQLGFGDKSVYEVCQMNQVDPEFFIEILNAFHNPDYHSKKLLHQFSCTLIITYIKKSHQYYLSQKIPNIEKMIAALNLSPENTNPEPFQLVERFFLNYRKELTAHILWEENHMHPYVLDLETAFVSKSPEKNIVEQIRLNTHQNTKKDKYALEDSLYDLKNILIKYVPATQNTQLILSELFHLESDLREHTRMEHNILIPKVKLMEKWLIDNYRG